MKIQPAPSGDVIPLTKPLASRGFVCRDTFDRGTTDQFWFNMTELRRVAAGVGNFRDPVECGQL